MNLAHAIQEKNLNIVMGPYNNKININETINVITEIK